MFYSNVFVSMRGGGKKNIQTEQMRKKSSKNRKRKKREKEKNAVRVQEKPTENIET